MATETFISKDFKPATMSMIADAQDIIEEYRRQGFVLTLRQLYYQFVARDKIANRQSEYKRLGSIVNDARLAGLIDWDSIEDRGRFVRANPHWDEPEDIMAAVARQFAVDKWQGQAYRPEVWIEKDALIGVIEGACEDLDVPFFACRGYNSQSEQYAAGKRFEQHIENGQIPIVFHLGDHDPSGIDMTRDNADRLAMFAWTDVEVRRLALNFDQVEEYSPPPNPAKLTDSRAIEYIALHGPDSWELDALEPSVIDDLIRNAIIGVRDPGEWNHQCMREQEGRDTLAAIANSWSEVSEYLADRGDQ